MTPQGHLELVSAEPQDGRVPSSDMEPDSGTLSSSASHLARSLAWMPGQEESHHFRDRCEALGRTFQPL